MMLGKACPDKLWCKPIARKSFLQVVAPHGSSFFLQRCVSTFCVVVPFESSMRDLTCKARHALNTLFTALARSPRSLENAPFGWPSLRPVHQKDEKV